MNIDGLVMLPRIVARPGEPDNALERKLRRFDRERGSKGDFSYEQPNQSKRLRIKGEETVPDRAVSTTPSRYHQGLAECPLGRPSTRFPTLTRSPGSACKRLADSTSRWSASSIFKAVTPA